MKLKYFLLLFAPVLLIDISPVFSAPVQILAQARTREQGDACQSTKQAVVTIYAGPEIGSGSIVSPDGLVITNLHVVSEVMGGRGQKRVSVRAADGNRYPGQVIATDRQYDLALIQLGARDQFPFVPLSSGNVQSGQKVCAIGSPFGRPGVLTRGTLSKIRQNGDLQSNVVLNPGNSGGPLLNLQGEMIGVNKAILESPSGGNTGISFATNVDAARNFITRNRPNSLPSTIARTPAPQPKTTVRPVTPPTTIARQPVPTNNPVENISRQPEQIYPNLYPQPTNQYPQPTNQYPQPLGQYPQPTNQYPQPSVSPDLQATAPAVSGHIVTITDGTNLTSPIPAQVTPESSTKPDFSPQTKPDLSAQAPQDDIYISPQPDNQPGANNPYNPPPSIDGVDPQEPGLDVPQPPEFNQRPPATGKRLGAVIDIRNLVIKQVQSGSPAAMGGLRAGDQLLTVNGQQLSDFDALMSFLQSQPNSAVFTVNRNSQVATVRISFNR